MKFFQRILPLFMSRSMIPIGSGERQSTTLMRDGITRPTHPIYTSAAPFTLTRTSAHGGMDRRGMARGIRHGTTGDGARRGTVITSSSITSSSITIISIPIDLIVREQLPGRMRSSTAGASFIRRRRHSTDTEVTLAMSRGLSRHTPRDVAFQRKSLRAVPEL